MPFPRSQLDLIIVLQTKIFHDVSDAICRIKQQFEQNGWLDGDEITASAKRELQLGDRSWLRFELSENYRLFANHQGGYRVVCPECNVYMTREFTSVVTNWRVHGGLPSEHLVQCVSCPSLHSLEECIGRPVFAFGMGAIHFVNVDVVQLPTRILQELNTLGVSFKTVLKRVG